MSNLKCVREATCVAIGYGFGFGDGDGYGDGYGYGYGYVYGDSMGDGEDMCHVAVTTNIKN